LAFVVVVFCFFFFNVQKEAPRVLSIHPVLQIIIKSYIYREGERERKRVHTVHVSMSFLSFGMSGSRGFHQAMTVHVNGAAMRCSSYRGH